MDIKSLGRFTAISSDGSLAIFWQVPDGVKEIDFSYWKWVLLFGAVPVIWAIRQLLQRRLAPDWQCHACGYNLTGNTSGICPECGAFVVRPALASPPSA